MHNYLFFPPPKAAFNQEKNDEVILRREPKVRAGLFFPPPKAAFAVPFSGKASRFT